jgi:hypothetical protein
MNILLKNFERIYLKFKKKTRRAVRAAESERALPHPDVGLAQLCEW